MNRKRNVPFSSHEILLLSSIKFSINFFFSAMIRLCLNMFCVLNCLLTVVWMQWTLWPNCLKVIWSPKRRTEGYKGKNPSTERDRHIWQCLRNFFLHNNKLSELFLNVNCRKVMWSPEINKDVTYSPCYRVEFIHSKVKASPSQASSRNEDVKVCPLAG